MQVKAKFPDGKYGFYGDKRRYNGDKFEIEPGHFSEKWMEKVEDAKKQSSFTPAK